MRRRTSDWQIWTRRLKETATLQRFRGSTIRAEPTGWQGFSGVPSLPLPQRLGRVDAHRAMRRQVDGDPADGREQGGHSRKRQWVNRGDLEQQALKEPAATTPQQSSRWQCRRP